LPHRGAILLPHRGAILLPHRGAIPLPLSIGKREYIERIQEKKKLKEMILAHRANNFVSLRMAILIF
jgi:hypothetical protein